MVELGIADWLIWIVYLSLITISVFIYKLIKSDDPNYNYILRGFGIKIFGGLSFALIYLYYYGFGDTFLYHNGAVELSNLLFEDSGHYFQALNSEHGVLTPEISYLRGRISFSRTSEEWFMVKLLSPLELISFGSYLTVTLFTSLIAFLGCWKLFIVFADILPKKNWAFAAAFLIPSVVFWTSGVIKDTITLAAFNFLVYFFYFWIKNRKINIFQFIQIIIFSWIIFKLKSYIILAFIPTVGLIFYLHFLNKIKSFMIRILLTPLIFSMFVGAIYLGGASLSDSSNKYQADKLETQVKGFHSWHTDVGGSSYSLGEIEYSATGVLTKVPAALNVTFFRPYLWEARNPVVLLGAVESFIVLILFIRALIVQRFRIINGLKKYIFLKGMMAFVVLFGFAVGFTSYNFGALARYKAPVMSIFVLILIILNLKKSKKSSNQTGFEQM